MKIIWCGRGVGALSVLGLALGVSLLSTGSASAQFCPAVVSLPSLLQEKLGLAQTGTAQIGGNCTDPKRVGAYSGAALASQALGDLAGTSTIEETSVAVQSIEERRETPPQACPAGEVLVDGICKAQPPAPAAPVVGGVQPGPGLGTAPAPAVSAVPKRLRAKAAKRAVPQVVAAPALPVHKPSTPVIYDQSFRIGAWAQGFGDYEHRSGDRNSFINCCTDPTVVNINNNIAPLVLEATSNLSSGGFVGGIDGTKRGLWSGQDGVVFGLLGGYTWTNISLTTTALSTVPTKTESGSSSTSAHINGPSLGGYLSYFNGPLSNDFLIKNDFLSLNETQSQLLGFGACSCFNVNAPFVTPQSGSGSTYLNQLTLSDDLNYKIPLSGWIWIAPTAGLRYINSTYASSAQALGLADGYIFRAQGGAKIGMNSFFNNVHVTTVLTGLLFNDVIVHGNNIQGGSFGQDAAILNDQGRIQGEGIAMVNLDFGGGLAASVEGDIYGAQGIFGAGGKATLRMVW